MPLDWGGTTKKGFTPVARSFLRHYTELGISMEEAMLILHVLDYAWNTTLPFPKVSTLCQYTGKTDKTIRTYLRDLRAKGLLKTVNRGGRSNEYDFSPLFEKLRTLSDLPEVVEVETQNTVEIKVSKTTQNLHSQTTPELPNLTTQDFHTPYKKSIPKEEVHNNPLGAVISAALAQASTKESSRKPLEKVTQESKQLRAFLSKNVSNYNCNDIEVVLSTIWRKKWTSVPPPKFMGRDRKHAKDLIEHYGPADTVKVISQVIENWEDYAARLSINGYPSMPLFWGYRNSLFPLVLQGNNGAKPKWGSHFDENNTRDPGDEIGW